DGRKIYANPNAANLIGGAGSLMELVPGSQTALSRARSEGSAELAFGVLRLQLRRIGEESDALIAAVFRAPLRPGEEPRALPEPPANKPAEAAAKPIERKAVTPAAITTEAATTAEPEAPVKKDMAPTE